jgi:hypothetical protein
MYGHLRETSASAPSSLFRSVWPAHDHLASDEPTESDALALGAAVRLAAILLAGGGASAYTQQLAAESLEETDKHRVDSIRLLRL